MSETNLLKFNTPTVSSRTLEIKVDNISGAKLDGRLLIEVQIPLSLVDSKVREAAELAGVIDETPNFASLAGVVTTDPGWTIWAFNVPETAAIRAYNYLNPKTAKDSSVAATLEAGASLTLCIPLAKENPLVQAPIPYSYQYGGKGGTTIEGTLELITAGAAAFKPQVSFTTDQTSPTMISAGQMVKLSWNITGGVSATIRGPMSGGHSTLRLGSHPYKIEQGSFSIRAVGAATYTLDAEVCGPQGPPNVQVIRTILLDVKKASKYANLEVRPVEVLPNGEVDINWAVWGIKTATLKIGDRRQIILNLTEQDLSRGYHGAGIWRVNATGSEETVKLIIKDDNEFESHKDKKIAVTKWINWTKSGYTGKPIAMAVAASKMALLTTDGIWVTQVGKVDDGTGEKDQTFRNIGVVAPKGWLTLTALDTSFVALQQTTEDGLRLARYSSDPPPPGKLLGQPIDLPDVVKPIVSTPGSFYDVVPFGNRVFGNRVYVVVQTPDGSRRRSFSVRFDPDEVRPEPWLERLTNYRLLTFDDGLYAVNRDTGQILRFELTAKGELDEPRKAASATYKGKSLIRKGMLIPVGSVLAVLDPDPFVIGLTSEELVGVTGAIETELPRKTDEQEITTVPKETTQDLVYNPQTNEWSPCGHGLKIKPGAVAAYRGGGSRRLWVLQPDGELCTLTGATERLFAQDYEERFPSKVLPPLLGGELKFKLVNQSGINLVPVDDVCRAAGLAAFSATGLENIDPMPDRLPPQTEKAFTLKYEKDNPGTVNLRYQAEGSSGPRYFLELTFSGPGLKSVSSAFKRLAGDGKVTEVQGTSEQHSADRPIVLSRAGQLTYKTTLFILNATTHDLNVYPVASISDFSDEAWVPINYATSNFRISAPQIERAGLLGVNIDFDQPPGIEMSPSSQAQRNLIRINTDHIHMLDVRIEHLKAGTSFEYQRYDGTKDILPAESDCYVCVVGLKSTKEITGVRLGDPAVSPDGMYLYIPLIEPQKGNSPRIWRMDTGNFAYGDFDVDTSTRVFSLPNSVAASQNKVHAIFGDTTLHENDRVLLSSWQTRGLTEYRQITALTAAANGDLFMVAVKGDSYFLVVDRASGQRSELLLKYLKFPLNGPPLAVSPDRETVAICRYRGLLTISVPDNSHWPLIDLPSVKEPAYVTFSHDRAWIYCAHLTREIGPNRRAVGGREMTVTRVNVLKPFINHTIQLPDVKDNFGLTGNTGTIPAGLQLKEDVAFTLAVSPDNRSLFVSAGTSILKIDTETFKLHDWRATVELPCRLIRVTEGWGNAWTLYALGSFYQGDGTSVGQYKTHLYAIPAPKD